MAAAPHYPVLRGFLWKLYSVHKKHMAIKNIDAMLSSGSVDELIEYLGLKDNLTELFSEEGAEHPIVSEDHSSPGLDCIERHLLITHADLIAELKSKFNDDAEFPCCCCEHLCRRTAVSCVDFSNFSKYLTAVWLTLKAHILQNSGTEKLYIYELKLLDALSKQLIQRAKAFQTIVRNNVKREEDATTLGLNHCGLGPEGLCEVCNAVRMNTTLTTLIYQRTGTMLRENKMLTTLGLNHCGLGPEGLCEVCNAVRMNTTLTYIDLSENRFDDKNITCLGTMLRENKMLTTLGLRRCGLGPEGLCEVCNAVRMNTTLTYIDLSENRFDDQNITCLGTMLRENKFLTSLLLMDCGLGQKGLCEVSSALEMSTTLIYLDLSGNTFNNQSIACLVQLLTNSQTLATLKLRECGLDEGAMNLLAKGLEHSKLKKLDLGGNHITTKGT
eukprot:Em0069g4a